MRLLYQKSRRLDKREIGVFQGKTAILIPNSGPSAKMADIPGRKEKNNNGYRKYPTGTIYFLLYLKIYSPPPEPDGDTRLARIIRQKSCLAACCGRHSPCPLFLASALTASLASSQVCSRQLAPRSGCTVSISPGASSEPGCTRTAISPSLSAARRTALPE